MRGGLLAGAAVTALLVAGCGHQAVAPVLDSAVASAPSDTSGTDAGCASVGIMVTNADNGKTLCVYQGTNVLVMLTTDSGGIRVTGPMTEEPALVPALVPGIEGAAYIASQQGVATITSVLSPCGSGPGLHCMLLELYHVTIDIVPSSITTPLLTPPRGQLRH
jgi:hypothetical protein